MFSTNGNFYICELEDNTIQVAKRHENTVSLTELKRRLPWSFSKVVTNLYVPSYFHS